MIWCMWPPCAELEHRLLSSRAVLDTARMDHVFAGALFKEVLHVALRVPQALPRNKLLRRRFISYLHRMVECLGTEVVPFLPQALTALLHDQCDAADKEDVVRVVIQLIRSFPDEMGGQLHSVLPNLVLRCATALQRLKHLADDSLLHDHFKALTL